MTGTPDCACGHPARDHQSAPYGHRRRCLRLADHRTGLPRMCPCEDFTPARVGQLAGAR